MADYVTGLLLNGDRKSIEPLAGRLVDDAAEIQASAPAAVRDGQPLVG